MDRIVAVKAEPTPAETLSDVSAPLPHFEESE